MFDLNVDYKSKYVSILYSVNQLLIILNLHHDQDVSNSYFDSGEEKSRVI